MGLGEAARVIGAGICGGLVVLLVQNGLPRAGGAGAVGPVVEASTINLRDSAGRLRAQLAISPEGGPGLWLMDERGAARVSLGVYPDQTGYIGLQDKDRNMIQLLRSFGPSEAPLLIFKHKGADNMILGLNPSTDPVPFLLTYEKSSSRRVHFGKYDGP